ncbi:MAG: HAD-IB family hydrolase [Bacteroidota bacterium]
MEQLLNDQNFQNKLKEIAKSQNASLTSLNEEAQGYLKEMFTTHQPVANVVGIQTAQYILSRGYKKTIDINSNEIKALTKLARRHPIAFVMTHKTYIDMFVLAVVLARHGLPIPFTFAGINMSFLGLGQFGRKIGVIFIRRSFKDNLVYKATLRHFISNLVREKSHFMWAIEGTRSRTGKLVWPRMGILKYIKDAEIDTRQEVKYIPVSIVYDLIPDVKEMTMEGRGHLKSPESLGWFLNYVKKLGDKFGRISLRFGPPVFSSSNPLSGVASQPERFMSANGVIPRFALELVHRINQITPVTTASLICISLLGKYALSKRAIESDLSDLMQLIERYKPDALVDRGKPIGESVQIALNLLRKAGLILQQSDDLNARYVIASENYLSTTYYANMAVHHLYHRAFIELAMLKVVDSAPQDRLFAFWSEIMELRNLFKFEFFYSRKAQFSDEIELNLNGIDPEWNQHVQEDTYDLQELLNQQKLLVAPVILNTYIEAYRVIIHALISWDPNRPFDEETFINNCLYLGEEMQWQGSIQRIESVSKPFLVNGLRLIRNRDLIPTPKDQKTEILQNFDQQLQELSQRIKTLQSIMLSKPHEESTYVPIERDIVPGSRTEHLTNEILKGESGPHIGAFFDLDRTLIKSFSAKEFFQTRLLSGRITAREVLAQFAGVLVYAMGDGNFAGLAAVGAKGVKGIKEQLFVQLGEEVYQKHLADEIYPESRALVAAHMAKGHTVAIISAATPYQVNPIARDLGIDQVMCTRMEVDNGVFTGNIVEPACWGDGKAYAAKELTKKYQLDLNKSYFYTDSAEDMPLMEIVGHPRPINPDTKLSAVAFQNDWPIYRFDDEDQPGVSNILRTGLAAGSLIPAVFNGVRNGALNLSWQEGVNSLMASVGDLVTSMAGIQLVVKGEEHLWSHRPAVFIFNHQSNVDLFIVSKLVRKNAVGIAKKELKHMPVIGQLMSAAGVIFIDRKNREKAIEAMKPAVDALRSGTSIIIFPEGTRSYDYQLGPFKKGAFHLAMQAGVPLVPVVIKNAHDVMPRGTNLFRPSAVEVIVLPPISTTNWQGEFLTQRVDEVRNLFLQELGQDEPQIDTILNNHKSKV